MEEKGTEVKAEENIKTATTFVKKNKLSPEATILLTIAGALLAIVVGRLCYWIITGN